MRSKVTVVCQSVCMSVNALTARMLISAIQTGYYQNRHDFAKMALFNSYAIIYLAIGAAIYEVLFVFYSYPNDATGTATFDRTRTALC